MKIMVKRVVCLLVAAITLFSFSISASAANQHFKRGYCYGGTTYSHTVSFTKWGTDKVTVVNTSSRGNIYVKCVGATNATFKYIAPNSEYTFAYYGNGPYKVTVQSCSTGTFTYRIKTTSGTIK